MRAGPTEASSRLSLFLAVLLQAVLRSSSLSRLAPQRQRAACAETRLQTWRAADWAVNGARRSVLVAPAAGDVVVLLADLTSSCFAASVHTRARLELRHLHCQLNRLLLT